MGGTESVVYIYIAELRKRLAEGLVVLFFFFIEAQVFEKDYLAVLAGRQPWLWRLADYISGEGDLFTEKLRKLFGYGSEGCTSY